jgi:hypothetical protein
MRRRAPQLFAVAAALVFLQVAGWTQAIYRPTPAPIVTAENENWFLNGEAIHHAGSVYYPAGPAIYFNPYEMVRSGDYRGIPLYSRTTLEPYSVVYVPLAGGWMKPYERPRSGDIAGTSGSRMPSSPVVGLYEPEIGPLAGVVRAPAPPMQIAPVYEYGVLPGAGRPIEPQPVATTGVPEQPYPLGPLVSAQLPAGLNGMFVEYQDRRWFISGPAVELEPSQFTRIGDYRGFPVYRRGDDEKTIYVTVARGARGLIAPYSARP